MIAWYFLSRPTPKAGFASLLTVSCQSEMITSLLKSYGYRLDWSGDERVVAKLSDLDSSKTILVFMVFMLQSSLNLLVETLADRDLDSGD